MNSTCAAFINNPENRCVNLSIENSVFCEDHSSLFLSKYLNYKKMDNKNNIVDNMSIAYYLKKFSHFQKIIQKRLNFREEAIAYSARDVGHQIRIDILNSLAEKCVSHLEHLFTQQETKIEQIISETVPEFMPESISETVPESIPKFVSTVKSTQKIQFKTKLHEYNLLIKRNQNWEQQVQSFTNQDDIIIRNDINNILAYLKKIPKISSVPERCIIKMGLFYSFFWHITDPKNLNETGKAGKIFFENENGGYNIPDRDIRSALVCFLKALGRYLKKDKHGNVYFTDSIITNELIDSIYDFMCSLEHERMLLLVSTDFHLVLSSGCWVITSNNNFFISLIYDKIIKNNYISIQKQPSVIIFKKDQLNVNLDQILVGNFNSHIINKCKEHPNIDHSMIVLEYFMQSIVQKMRVIIKLPDQIVMDYVQKNWDLMYSFFTNIVIYVSPEQYFFLAKISKRFGVRYDLCFAVRKGM